MKSILNLLPIFSIIPFSFCTQYDEHNGKFYLRTKVVAGPSIHTDSKDGLYVTPYHTGTGLNDVVLSSDKSYATRTFLNDTTIQVDFGDDVPWAFQMPLLSTFDGWNPVELNAGLPGAEGFYFNDSDATNVFGLKWTQNYPSSYPSFFQKPPVGFYRWLGMLLSFDSTTR